MLVIALKSSEYSQEPYTIDIITFIVKMRKQDSERLNDFLSS